MLFWIPAGAGMTKMKVSSSARGDECREQPLVAFGKPVFGMPLHADAEAPARVFDALDHAVGHVGLVGALRRIGGRPEAADGRLP